MVLKAFAVLVVVFAVSVVYLHEFHRNEIVYLSNNIPAIRNSLSSIHQFLAKISLFPSPQSEEKLERIFSHDELSKFNGESGSQGIYLAILGKVYDVTKGSKHYGPGGSYHAFAGKYNLKFLCLVTNRFVFDAFSFLKFQLPQDEMPPDHLSPETLAKMALRMM